MKYIYLINRFKLKDKTDMMVNKLVSVSEELNREYETIIVDKVEDVHDVMDSLKDRQDIITAIGGDGSLNLVLNDIIDTKNILAFVPYGTGNDFVRAIMQDNKDGLQDIDVIKINDRYFINVACFGIDADIANDERYIHNNLIPPSMRYNAGVVHHFLTYKPRIMKVECDNQVFEKPFTTVVVANSKYYGGGYNVSPNSKINDGKMEVLMVDKLNKVSMAKIILSMKDAGHLNNPALKMFETDKLVISSDKPFGANIDGEPLISDRFEIEILPKRFRIDINKNFINKMIQK